MANSIDDIRKALETKNSIEAMEYRTIGEELRMDGEGGKLMVGHAAVFNQKSLPMFGFQEQVISGAFKKTIKESDIRALWNHNPDRVLGRNKAGTLDLEEDKRGLAVKITPPETQWANDLRESIRRKDVSQMSFAFRTIKDSWHMEDGIPTRNLEEVRLFDVSPVTYPAYPTTDISVRGLAFAATQLTESKDLKLFKAMLRLQAGEELRVEDMSLLTIFAETLQKKLKSSEPGPAHSDAPKPPETRHLDVEKLRLDLIKIQEAMK